MVLLTKKGIWKYLGAE